MRMNCADHVEHCVVLSVCVSSGKRFVVVAGRRTMSDFIRFPNVLRSIRTILLYFVIGHRKRKQCNKMTDPNWRVYEDFGVRGAIPPPEYGRFGA